jgi:thiamine phosphate synthase YjbQ (UPF0047 family)
MSMTIDGTTKWTLACSCVADRTKSAVLFKNGKLMIGVWQQIVVAEMDNIGMERNIILQ